MLADPTELEIMYGRRAFPVAQQLLAGLGTPQRTLSPVTIGWHDTSLSDESGSFCVVDAAGDQLELIGEVLSFTALNEREVFAYCLGSAGLPDGIDISVSRRVFLGLGLLALESLQVVVEVLG